MEEFEELKKFTTEDLVEELKTREAVQHIFTEPYKKVDLFIDNKKQDLQINEGPVNIIIVCD